MTDRKLAIPPAARRRRFALPRWQLHELLSLLAWKAA